MQSANASELTTDIAVIGGGAAGIGVIASLLKRSPGLRISLIEPADTHYYQPGWTLVGGGAYAQGDTARPISAGPRALPVAPLLPGQQLPADYSRMPRASAVLLG